MSPTQVYRCFKDIFPDFKIIRYTCVKGDPNAINMEDEWGQRYFFRYVTSDFWSFQTFKYKTKGEK